ncbi:MULTISPECIES: aminotransferase class V-fold PLP-dependent enzyme [unclassified Mesorhizobium]|uniref:aminotransferase class V-fold PLP-dependent enzyme n=1 Tax=unclassified Mesorhizobium TaxID=325217 RepID=UPI001CCDE7A3|nr:MULTISPECIES: aminotransferase class V-fold PLP-dependent enzyme [unclassified Mesorhizobium]MBZ9743567.1 aminotransferase class V-fold PLP-dependent enzyme [Mesorhizobium sp. CO1-1-4]MBZ9806228.1 aminotransferase class V-fold PLP-dependent enzyme [Mesorhizobium sp. ES1-6]
MLSCQRDLFTLTRDTAYLDAAYMSPIPIAAIAAGEAGVRVKAEPWKMTIASYYDEVEQARQLAASMVGANADDIAIVAATSYGMAIAAANVPVPAGSAILLMENEHTSHRYVWYDLADRAGAFVDIVPQPADGDWTGAIVSAIRSSDRPIAVVAGTLVHWFEGMAIDLEAVAVAARTAGAALVVDGTQWVGAVPFDVSRVRPDFLAFATYKFLLGPYRLAFLYAAPRWHEEGRTLEHHSWNRLGGDKSDFYKVPVAKFLPGARRFDMGERSDFAVLPIAIAAMKLIEEWSVERVFERLRYLNDFVWAQAESRGLEVERPRLPAPHISILDIGDRLAPNAAQDLKQANVHVTLRGTKMRVSPHVYNDEEDIDRLFQNLPLR